MRLLRLILKNLLREWRSGEVFVLFISLVIAVAAVSSVSFFTNRVQQALNTQANELLGADLVLNSDHEFAEQYVQKAIEFGLAVSREINFPTMVISQEGSQLAWLKAVENNFPLRGKLGVSKELFAPENNATEPVAIGKVWLEPRLVSALNLKVGDRVSIGDHDLILDAILTSEPGRGGDLFNIAPRALVNLSDLPKTNLLQPGSRARYSLLIAGQQTALDRYRKYLENSPERGVNVQGIRDARPEIRVALSRADQFLGLAAMTSVILAGVAIALAARRFSQRHLDHCAIMRCVGATQGLINRLYVSQILVLGLVASLIGAAIGYFVHGALISLLGSFVGVALPAPSITPFLFSIATGMIILLGFALPPIIALRKVPALRVLRRDVGNLSVSQFVSLLLGLFSISVIMILQANDFKMGIYMVMGAIGAVFLLAIVAYLLILLVRRGKQKYQSAWWYGLRNIVRRPAASIIQIIAFGLGIMALLVLTLIRGDLLDEWQASIPENAPNRFIINIQPDQVSALQSFFRNGGYPDAEIYPMIRGRLVKINGQSVNADDFTDRQAKQILSRELNLSWASELPGHNKLVNGTWWADKSPESGLLSVEKGMFDSLRLKLGDELSFQVGAESFSAKVSNVREVDWGSFRANFYALASPGILEGYPATYMLPIYIAASDYPLLNSLVKEFPNVTVIDVAAIMSHVREIISRVTIAVEYVFIFTLLSGVMVLLAGLQATQEERMVENAVVLTLGGRRKQILQSLVSEFFSLGCLSGIVAAMLASLVAAVLSHFVLKMPVHWNANVWLYGLIGGAFGVGLVGVLGSLRVVRQPPLQTLRSVYVSN